MKFLQSKEISKKVIIAILLVMSFNFISPTISLADKDEFGGALFKPIAQLLLAISDLVVEGLQKIFVGYGEIEVKNEGNSLSDDGHKAFLIRYGPAVIFSNLVPALDVNFFNPQYTESNPYKVEATSKYIKNYESLNALGTYDNFNSLLTGIFNVLNEKLDTSSKKDLEIVITTDYKQNNECQIEIVYKHHIIYIRSGDNGDMKELSKIIANKEKYNGSKSYTYDEFITTYNKNKSAIDNVVKKHEYTWTTMGETIKKDYQGENFTFTDTNPSEPTKDGVGFDMSLNLNVATLKVAKEQWETELKRIVEENGGKFDESKYNKDNSQTDLTFENAKTYSWVNSTTQDEYNVIYYFIPAAGYSLKYVSVNYSMSRYTAGTITTGDEKVSTSYELQKTIASWYKALRAIALVGLLSVLVYVGIRILISSTGQEKAKYKKMIVDWVTAICILFVLQYIMVFIFEITQKITDILKSNAIGPRGEDILMSNLRTDIGPASTFSVIFAELLMYLVLIIYTVMFTIQYLKRLVYMAFFTMIAPLIALTYPLDKIKDGQAQAFSTWIREYIFNALLQPMHLLLYTIFVSSAMEFVKTNPLYAIVVVGFLLPAEKFFRKMFGFDKASSSNQLGAAAGGALIMNAINKMGHSSGKKAAGGSGSSGDSGSSSSSTPRYVAGPADGSGGNDIHNAKQSPFDGDGSIQTPGAAKSNGILNGAKTLGGHYINSANGKKIAKGLARTAGKVGVGAVGAATLGTVGLAAGIATGDPGNALKYGAAGAAAGYMGANNLGDKAVAFGKTNAEIFQEGRLGTAEYNTRKSISELTGDNDFNQVCKQTGQDPKQLIRQFHTNGITGSADIKKSVNIMAQTGATPAQIITAQRLNQEAQKYGMKRKDIEERLNKNKNIDTNTMLNLIDKL